MSFIEVLDVGTDLKRLTTEVTFREHFSTIGTKDLIVTRLVNQSIGTNMIGL